VTTKRKGRGQGKILLDPLLNARGASAVVPYSPRAHEGALIALPLSWQELENGARPDHFDLRSVIRRLEGNPADPWHGFWQLSQTLPSSSLRKRLAVA
jgi:bifunctional non-homologous end joining protein LigD